MAVDKTTIDRERISRHQGAKEQARIEAIFSSIGTGAITTDGEGRIERVNDRALELLGFSREELMGQWFPQVLVALTDNNVIIDPMDRPITQSFLSGKPVVTRTNYLRKDGSILPASITVSPIILANKPVGAVEVFEDVTLELEIDRMKSEFISLASHQLRTPLTAINIYTQMLLDGYEGELNEHQKESLDTILKSSQRMNKLISALLDISKMEAGKISTTNARVELDQILEQTVSELEQDAMAKDIQLTTKIDGANFTVHSDALLVGEVYSNLISNAIKYTPDKGKVAVSLRADENNYVFRVRDNGYGIPADFQEKIFKKFSRAANAQQVDTTGSGLGLYMAKEIATVLKGRLWFTSKHEKGTSFYFSIPKPVA
jgi:PAS domain S-box-containing protein